jgi:hypothetical protein
MTSSFGPTTPFQHLIADPEALAIVQRLRPRILDDADTTLQPFTRLSDLVDRGRGAGDEPPDAEDLWTELAAITDIQRPEPDAPQPPRPNYEGEGTPVASARLDQTKPAERWGTAEVILSGPSHGNPFIDVDLRAIFRSGTSEITVGGFYDGDGIYRIRFMPPTEGTWTVEVTSNARSLNGVRGEFEASSPTEGNRGRVTIRDGFHFAYDDGTDYLPFGTTAYAWTHQPVPVQEQTLKTLADTAFTKLRMCLFPKSFVHNTAEPDLYPFERAADGSWDFTRFSLPYFRTLEARIAQLRTMGIEADLILFHPYDRWGFSRMPRWADQRYTEYVVRRLAGFRNVWWSLANEYDFMPSKTTDDWEGIAAVISREDHANHLTSIHNGFVLYDYGRPWITHCSIQKNDLNHTGQNVDEWRRFGKPVVIDEIGYEGNLEWGWGNLTAQELVRRAWDGAVRGGYVNHGETYDSDIVWWSHGGVLHGESPERFAFLREIVSQAPSGRFEPLNNGFDFPWGGDSDHRLIYFGSSQPARRHITLPPGTWAVDIIDTWEMTVTTLPAPAKDAIEVTLPGRPYCAVRLRRES